jgi:hypothetical protein
MSAGLFACFALLLVGNVLAFWAGERLLKVPKRRAKAKLKRSLVVVRGGKRL